jgi:predicted NBD/HSP70 family sugar kinase
MSVLLFDIGATNTRLVLADGGQMRGVVHAKTDHGSDGFERLVAQMQTVVAGEQLEAIVGGMRAQREGPEGRFVLDNNLTAWLGVPVKARLEQTFACRVRIENDAVIAGLGEAHLGAGIAHGVMVYVTVSTGVNLVRLLDGEPDPTIERFELGQQLVGDKEGHAVSLEAMTAGSALERLYGRPPAQIHERGVWPMETEHLARGLYNMMLYWMPEVVVFGGSMMKDIDLTRLRDDLKLWPAVWTYEPKLVRAKLGDEAGLRGALWLSTHLDDH